MATDKSKKGGKKKRNMVYLIIKNSHGAIKKYKKRLISFMINRL